MSVLFRDTMTVYNYRRNSDTGEEFWNRTVVGGIQWRHNKTELSITNGVQTANKVESITIDFQHEYGNKQYLPPNDYKKLSNEESIDYWTLDAETGQDMLVEGISEKVVGENYRLSELKDDFQYAVTVRDVSDNRGALRLRNIKVVGR